MPDIFNPSGTRPSVIIFGIHNKSNPALSETVKLLKQLGMRIGPTNFTQEETLELFRFPSNRLTIKITDNIPQLLEGLKAGFWTIALIEPNQNLEAMQSKFSDHGAHYIIHSTEELLPIIEAIQYRLSQGQSPTTNAGPSFVKTW